MAVTKLGVIGGSGIYEIDGVENGQWVSVETPFGIRLIRFSPAH